MKLLTYCILFADFTADFPTDVYFGEDYEKISVLAGVDVKVIYLQMCWDGADMHHNMKADKSMWPLFYCIMNLPPSVRHVPHVGMHLAGLDLGAMCSLEVFADELQELWNTGFVVGGQRYKVFLIEILTDSRGREKLMKVQGAGSLAGCSKCDFEGRTFDNTRVYDRWRRYLPADDARRNKMTSIRSRHQVCNYYSYFISICNRKLTVCIYVVYMYSTIVLSGAHHRKTKTTPSTQPMQESL